MAKTKPQKERERDREEEVPDWSVIAGLRSTDLDEIVADRLAIKAEIAALRARDEELKAAGTKLLIKAKVKTVLVNGARVTKMEGNSTKLDKVKFYQLGGKKAVDAYNAALVKTPYTTMLITVPGEKGEGGE